jgi:hypothetical protein
MRGALSGERKGLSYTTAAGPRQRSHSCVRVPWDLQPYFTVSDSRLAFLSPPTTRRTTVEVFDTAFTLIYELETSLMMRGIQIGEMSKLGWLIGLVKQADL